MGNFIVIELQPIFLSIFLDKKWFFISCVRPILKICNFLSMIAINLQQEFLLCERYAHFQVDHLRMSLFSQYHPGLNKKILQNLIWYCKMGFIIQSKPVGIKSFLLTHYEVYDKQPLCMCFLDKIKDFLS